MKTLVAVDYSGSTALVKLYWEKVNDIYNHIKKTENDITYILWSDDVTIVNNLDNAIKDQRGDQGYLYKCVTKSKLKYRHSDVLPSHVIKMCEWTFKMFEKVKNVPIEEAINRYKNSMSIEKRIVMEAC